MARLLALIALVQLVAAERPFNFFSKSLDQPAEALGLGHHLSGYTEGAREDYITSLPGLKHDFPSRQFSGYLEVNKTKGRNIFYWFVEAEKDPANAPVLFWTNGGPGCSGLIGFLTEHGPFRVTKDGGELKENPYAWTKEANIFYVEQPAGVGFSYSEDPFFYNVSLGDQMATEDNYRIVLKFFEKFPQYKSNEFYISSESYGGHYMPMLAKLMVDEQAKIADEEKLKFRGFLVGNPYNNLDENMIGMVSAFWGRQLIPKPVHDEWFQKCIVDSKVCPTWATSCVTSERHQSPEDYAKCAALVLKMRTDIGDLDVYGLDWPVCENDVQAPGRMQRLSLMRTLGKGKTHPLGKPEPFVPCEEGWSVRYLNRADVQEAIHVRQSATADKWIECANQHNGTNPGGYINYNETDHETDMSDYYRYLIDGGFGLKILIFSGDADSVCATSGTQTWMYDLGYPVTKDWAPWKVEEQVAGYVTKFQGFNFVSVHDSGHEVPMYQPKRALEVLRKFLADEF